MLKFFALRLFVFLIPNLLKCITCCMYRRRRETRGFYLLARPLGGHVYPPFFIQHLVTQSPKEEDRSSSDIASKRISHVFPVPITGLLQAALVSWQWVRHCASIEATYSLTWRGGTFTSHWDTSHTSPRRRSFSSGLGAAPCPDSPCPALPRRVTRLRL